MASNPMQRKARNSFLIGVLITTLVLGTVIGFLIFDMYKNKKEQEAIELAKQRVYVLVQDVKAGASVVLTDETTGATLLRTEEVDSKLVPTTSVTSLNYGTFVNANTLYKIDLKAGTVLTQELLVEAEDVTNADTREQEYNMIILPTYLQKDDYVDIRLRLPSGEDYIVVSKKKVIDTNETTIWMHLSEAEILTLGNAIVEAYQIEGSELYATTYIEPGIQGAATATYVPSTSVIRLIEDNPNVIQTAKNELRDRYNLGTLLQGRTEIINSALNAVEEAQGKVSAGVSSSTESRRQSRKEYLQELEAAAQKVTTTTTK